MTLKEDIDFNELWKMKNGAECKKSKTAYDEPDRAKWFNRIIKGHKERTERQLSSVEVGPGDTVLDIGAGTGRMAIPLAKKVRAVTAIEPSKNMLACLKNNMDLGKVSNIKLINKTWDEIELGADIEPHDIVIASHSFGMFDIRSALEKMDLASKRSVYLFNFVTDIDGLFWMDDCFWNQIRDDRSTYLSDYMYHLIVLHEMGIYANVKVWNSKFVHQYNSLREIVEYLMRIYKIPTEKEGTLKERIIDMVEEKDGKLFLNGVSKSALIWWNKGDGRNGDFSPD